MLGLIASWAMAQTPIPLINPGFETNADTMQVFTAEVDGGFDVPGWDVLGWTNCPGPINNAEGVYFNKRMHTGLVCAQSQCGKAGAYQVTGYQMQSGDELTLTWWARDYYGPQADQLVNLLGATNITDDYTQLVPLAASTAPLTSVWTQYTLNYIVASTNVGLYVVISFSAPGGGGNYTTWDDFALTVGPATDQPLLGTVVAAPNPCYALSIVTITNSDAGPNANSTFYQWQTNSDISGGLAGTWGNITGATHLTVLFPPPDLSPGGTNYTLDCQLVASNSAGSVTSTPVALVVRPASIPVVLTDTTPNSASISAGSIVSFTATFVGTIPITYQWQTDAGQPGIFANIPNATNTTITVNGGANNSMGNYQLVATNVVGSTTSTPAYLTVSPLYFGNLLKNPSFEFNNEGQQITSKITGGFDVPGNDVAGWLDTGTSYGGSGVDYAGDSALTVVDGTECAFLREGDDGAYQITGYQLQAGDQLTLTWWAQSEYQGGAQLVELLSATNINETYSNMTVLATDTDPIYYVGKGAPYYQYTLTYTAQGADAGNYVAVSFFDANSSDNSYVGFDAFNLTVLQSSPTISIAPSANQLQLNWLDGVLLEATNITGPWTTNIYAVSPFTITPVGPVKFYKTQLQGN